jgi:uncharacterized protein YecT (DUF1311 family)
MKTLVSHALHAAPFILLGLLATEAPGAGAPSFNCEKAQGSVEEAICADAELARLDRLVAQRYASALSTIRALDTGGASAEADLRSFQRGWIKGRDECWKAGDLKACVTDSYLRREGELVAMWLLDAPQNTASWICGGPGPLEVVTYFFATERPSLRFEIGDTLDTASLVPTASGSKYEGSFGRSIWIKGQDATYREADPDGTALTCRLAMPG